MECGGEEIWKGYRTTVDDCAFACNGVSKYFIFGTNATADDKCSSDGRCRCLCETPNPCEQETNSYNIYQFERGNLSIIFLLPIPIANVHLKHGFYADNYYTHICHSLCNATT